MFEFGALYTREEIHGHIGGGLQSYLPHVGGRVVAACLRPDFNPDAPAIVLVGTGEGIESAAEMFATQLVPVPVFLRCGSGRWEFVAGRSSRDSVDLETQANGLAGVISRWSFP